jgi:hypothetical protein
MGRLRMVCVAAALALTAVVVGTATASAEPPAWHYCAKTTAKNTGSFSDKGCSVKSEVGKGAYELFTGVGKGKAFKGKVKVMERVIQIIVPGKADLRLECQKSAISGHTVAPRGVVGVRLTFSKCELLDEPCGTVTTEALSGELGWLNKAKGIAGVSLSNEASPGTGYIVQFTCMFGSQPVKFRSNGAFIGAIPTTTAISKELTLEYVVFQYLEELNEPTNPPAFEEAFVGTLQTEINSPESKFEWTPEGGWHSGVEATFPVKGEALAIY